MATSGIPNGKVLVLFDGVCNVCNASVLFIIDRDPGERFVFAPLTSELARTKLRARGLDDLGTDTMVVIADDKVYTHSNAALYIARHMSGPWPILSALMALPRPIRDVAYRAFAKRRYALFGKSEQCRVPTPELRRRFLA